jgi:uncharacterized protein
MERQQSVCVFCRKRPVEAQWRPFCSQRCKVLDLAAWAEGKYSVPAEPAPDAGEDDEQDDRPG